MDLFDRVLEFITGCVFSACHFFPADIRQTESSGKFGAPQFFWCTKFRLRIGWGV